MSHKSIAVTPTPTSYKSEITKDEKKHSHAMTYTEAFQIIKFNQDEHRVDEDRVKVARRLLLQDHVYRGFYPALQWINNSCYFSTLMVAMFLQPCEYITKNILLKDDSSETASRYKKRQILTDKINDLVLNMRIFHPHINNIDSIRLAFIDAQNAFPTANPIEPTRMETPTQVLWPLIEMYEMGVWTSMKKEKFNIHDVLREKSLETTVSNHIANPLLIIDTFKIENYRNANGNTNVIDVSRVIPLPEDKQKYEVEYTVTEENVYKNKKYFQNKKLKFIVVEINDRRLYEQNFTIVASPRLALFPNLTLTTVICLRGIHYTCIYFNRDDRNWYHFNDISGGIPRLIDENQKDKKIREEGYFFFYQEN